MSERLEIDWSAHLEALPLATWIEGKNGIYANQLCRDLLGFPALMLSPQAEWITHVHPSDSPRVRRLWLEFMEGRSNRFADALMWVRPDNGETVLIVVRVQHLLCGDLQGWARLSDLEEVSWRLREIFNA